MRVCRGGSGSRGPGSRGDGCPHVTPAPLCRRFRSVLGQRAARRHTQRPPRAQASQTPAHQTSRPPDYRPRAPMRRLGASPAVPAHTATGGRACCAAAPPSPMTCPASRSNCHGDIAFVGVTGLRILTNVQTCVTTTTIGRWTSPHHPWGHPSVVTPSPTRTPGSHRSAFGHHSGACATGPLRTVSRTATNTHRRVCVNANSASAGQTPRGGRAWMSW